MFNHKFIFSLFKRIIPIKSWITCFLFSIFPVTIYSQNIQTLLAEANKQVEANEIVLNSLFICLSKSWNYTNTAKYAVILNRNEKYRFILVNSTELKGRALLKLRYLCDVKEINSMKKKMDFPADNYIKDALNDPFNYESFEFTPKLYSGVYQLHVSFQNGDEGCAAVLIVYKH